MTIISVTLYKKHAALPGSVKGINVTFLGQKEDETQKSGL